VPSAAAEQLCEGAKGSMLHNLHRALAAPGQRGYLRIAALLNKAEQHYLALVWGKLRNGGVYLATLVIRDRVLVRGWLAIRYVWVEGHISR
jgi:hypothetical protein